MLWKMFANVIVSLVCIFLMDLNKINRKYYYAFYFWTEPNRNATKS